jgi:hypothetical protein
VTGRELVRWSVRHERRARAGWWASRWVIAIACGGALAAWVAWRDDAAGVVAASHAWLGGALAAFALAFFRVPFHVYWRADASLLAQLPIEGGPLFDAALVRCVRAAAATTLAVAIAAVPLAARSLELAFHHVALAGALGLAAAFLLPAVATWTAALVATQQQAIAKAVGDVAFSPGAMLGAVPGVASSGVVIFTILVAPWLVGDPPPVPAIAVLGGLAAASIVAIAAARAIAPRVMALVLRDVSALDRQRLATLDIRGPTAIERLVAGTLGDGALPYRKDARLVRRRFPMAFALGALAFIAIIAIGIARPTDPAWLAVAIASGAIYGVVLARRLHRSPIELPRLAATLPIGDAARRRAKLAWIAAWWTLFVAAPSAYAIARVDAPLAAAIVLAAGTIGVLAAGRYS